MFPKHAIEALRGSARPGRGHASEAKRIGTRTKRGSWRLNHIILQSRSLGRHVSTSFLDPVFGAMMKQACRKTLKSLAAECLVGVRLELLNFLTPVCVDRFFWLLAFGAGGCLFWIDFFFRPFMASARSLHTFNRGKQLSCNLHAGLSTCRKPQKCWYCSGPVRSPEAVLARKQTRKQTKNNRAKTGKKHTTTTKPKQKRHREVGSPAAMGITCIMTSYVSLRWPKTRSKTEEPQNTPMGHVGG